MDVLNKYIKIAFADIKDYVNVMENKGMHFKLKIKPYGCVLCFLV